MSYGASERSPELTAATPEWLRTLLTSDSLDEGTVFELSGQTFVIRSGIPRSQKLTSESQSHTSDTFGYKWNKRQTFDSPASLARMRAWLITRYGDIAVAPWLSEHGESPLMLDAGCGAAMSALELFADAIPRLRYIGVDVSDAIDVARRRFLERGLHGVFLQADINDLPFSEHSVDLIFSEGVLHHTDSTDKSLKTLSRLLKPGGRFLFYVYRRKGPVREFTDDYVRAQLQEMSPEEAWNILKPLTQLGISLGELDREITVPEPIELLAIPAGRTTIQRLFYWHVAKMFYHPELTFDEMNHINFDWYTPANAHRHTPEEIRQWCSEAGLLVEREVLENAGITMIARKR
jgi:SAM-dependent methyltransferase